MQINREINISSQELENKMENTSLPTESQVQRFFLNCYETFMKWAFVTTPGSQPLVRSYLFLRRFIGFIGVVLPLALVIGTIILNRRFEVSDSISAYYYSVMGNIFVGSLWAVGVFLICYQYDRLDNLVSNIAGVCAIGLSLFPTPPDLGPTDPQEIIGKVHFSFATGFLVALAIMAGFLFTRKNPDQATVSDKDRKQKRTRNIVYVSCSVSMFVCIVLAAIILFVPYLADSRWHHQYHPILIIEFVAIEAFGIAWFVKGQTIDALKAAIHRRPLSNLAESGHPVASPQLKVEQSNGLPQDSSSAVHFFAQLSNYEIERDSLVVNFQARVTLGTWTEQKKEPHSASSQLIGDWQLSQTSDEVTDDANKASDGVGTRKI